MTQRTQISLSPEDHRLARARAADLGISLAEYVRRLVARDLRGPSRRASAEGLFDLGSSGAADVAASKDRYLAEAVDTRRERP